MKLTLFHGEGAININKLLIKNVIINQKKVNKEKYNEMKACVRKFGLVGRTQSCFTGSEKIMVLVQRAFQGMAGSLIKRLSWILSFSFSLTHLKDDLFVAELT